MNTTYWEDIKQSLYNFFNNKLLEQGAYTNISLGEKDKFGNDLSKLYPVTDATLPYPVGHIWQSSFHNWNYQSGVVNVPSPFLVSGIYINSSFVAKDAGMHVDYENGRVILDTAIATTGLVQAPFAVKEYSFLSPISDKQAVHETQFKVNDTTNSTSFAADPSQVYLPAIFVEIEEANEQGFEFGGIHSTMPLFRINIISDSRAQVEAIASALVNQSTRSFPIVSAALGPKFDYFNDLTENYNFASWTTLSDNFAYIKSVKYNRFFSTNQEQKEPHLYGGVVIVEILAVR